MKNIKIKGVSLIIFLIIVILSSSVAYADEISNESLSILKEKEHLYYEDFDTLKTESSLLYVIDKNSGETVYPQRIKNEDLLELEEKLSKKEIADFKKEAFPSYFEKYSFYNLVSKDGTEYLIFLENPKVTITFKSKDTPYFLYVQGEKIKVNTDKYDLTLPKGKIYRVKAEYEDSLKEIELDLTNFDKSEFEKDIDFGTSSTTKAFILAALIVIAIIVLGVLYFTKGSTNKSDEKIKKSSKSTAIKKPDNSDPVELNEENDINENLINTENDETNIVSIEPTSVGTQNKPTETTFGPDGNIYEISDTILINNQINFIKKHTKLLCDDLREKKGELNALKPATRVDEIELNNLREGIKEILGLSDSFINEPIKIIEENFKNLNNFNEKSKKEKKQEIWYGLNNALFCLKEQKINSAAIKERILYIRNFDTGLPEKSSKYMEDFFYEIQETINNLANNVKVVEENSKQGLNDVTEKIKGSLSNFLSNVENDLDFITRKIDKDSLENENNSDALNKLIVDYNNKESLFIKKIAELEKTITNINSNNTSLSQELKEVLSNALKGENQRAKNSLTLKSDELIEKLIPLTEVNQEYRDRFKNLDEKSILFLSQGDMIKSLLDNYELSEYSPVYTCYIKTLERELKAIVGSQRIGLGEYIRCLKTQHIIVWNDFINDFEKFKFKDYRNDATHTEPITKDVVGRLRNFLLEKKAKGKKGWLEFIDEQKAKVKVEG